MRLPSLRPTRAGRRSVAPVLRQPLSAPRVRRAAARAAAQCADRIAREQQTPSGQIRQRSSRPPEAEVALVQTIPATTKTPRRSWLVCPRICAMGPKQKVPQSAGIFWLRSETEGVGQWKAGAHVQRGSNCAPPVSSARASTPRPDMKSFDRKRAEGKFYLVASASHAFNSAVCASSTIASPCPP